MSLHFNNLIISQHVKSDLSHGGYQVSVSYNNGLTLDYFGNKLISDNIIKDFIYKKEQIKSVVFDLNLTIETFDGKIILEDIYLVESQ